jgi:hypothetical protein
MAHPGGRRATITQKQDPGRTKVWTRRVAPSGSVPLCWLGSVETPVNNTTHAAVVAHLQSGKHRAVAIWNLSVLIVPDSGFWFAQGIEIDYGAQGNTPEDAQHNFQEGLIATVRQHLRVYGDITRILKFAPSEILKEVAQNKSAITQFAEVLFHDIFDDGDGVKARTSLPFDGINYRLLEP